MSLRIGIVAASVLLVGAYVAYRSNARPPSQSDAAPSPAGTQILPVTAPEEPAVLSGSKSALIATPDDFTAAVTAIPTSQPNQPGQKADP